MEKLSFFDQIERNKLYSNLLILFMFLFLIGFGLVFSIIIGYAYDPSLAFLFFIFAIVFSIGYTITTYYYSDRIALASVGAHPASETKDRQLIGRVEGLALAAGIPAPKVHVMDSPDINAFAAGRDPENSVICVTRGALERLNQEELEGVLAHEMTHVANYDIRFVTLVAVMVGVVAIASEMFLRSMWYGGGHGRSRENQGGGIVILMVVGVILAIIAPLIVKLVQFAISRKREYMADAGAVQLTRYPPGLASALEKIRDYYKGGPKTHVNEAVAPMFFADPTRARFVELFNTHPPIDERIRALRSM